MQRLITQWAIAGAASFSAVASAAMLQSDDFQSGTTEGWSSGATHAVQATGGPAGVDDAFLLVTAFGGEFSGSRLATHNIGPDWVGDYAGIGASSVTVELRYPQGSPPLEMRLVLFGSLNTPPLAQRWTSTVSTVVPSDGVWRNYEFSLAEADLTSVAGAMSYDDLIGSVVQIMLRHQDGPPSHEGDGIAASLGIDNIRLKAAPPLLTADFDGDGDVDGDDFLEWQRTNGTSTGLTNWQTGYGDAPSAEVASVPEPSGLLVLIALVTVRIRVRLV